MTAITPSVEIVPAARPCAISLFLTITFIGAVVAV